jgi:hypothetical protein
MAATASALGRVDLGDERPARREPSAPAHHATDHLEPVSAGEQREMRLVVDDLGGPASLHVGGGTYGGLAAIAS